MPYNILTRFATLWRYLFGFYSEADKSVSVGMNMYASEWSTLAELYHVSRFMLNVIIVYKVEFRPEHEFATI